jgi:hypothetical protein
MIQDWKMLQSQTVGSLAIFRLLGRSFTFTAKGTTFVCNVTEAVAVLVVVREQLLVDACACTFSLSDVGIFNSLRCIVSVSAVSDIRSLSSLGQKLCNLVLEQQSVCSETDRLDLNSIDLSSLSIDAVDEILSEASFYIKSEDILLLRLLCLGSEYLPLLRHIEIGFLSIVELIKYLIFPPESV